MLRRAFTLVEILIVVAIIAILVGLLFPAIRVVRSNALSTKCAANLRQCILAITMYAQDNSNQLVPSKLYTQDTGLSLTAYPNGVQWHDFIEPYVERQIQTWETNEHHSITWGCPSWTGGGSDGLGGYNPGYTGYGKNYNPLAPADWHLDSHPDADSWGWPAGFEIFRINNLPAPPRRILLGDSVQWSLQPSYGTGSPADRGNWPNWSGDPKRHRGMANYAYLDGHVKMLDQYNAWDGCFGLGNN